MYLPVIARLVAQHGLVTGRQLADAGVDAVDLRRLLAAGVLVRLRRGVYVDADAWSCLDPFARSRCCGCGPRGSPSHPRTTPSATTPRRSSSSMGAPDPRTALVHVSRTKVHGDAVRAGVKHHLAPYRAGTSRRSTAFLCSIVRGLPRHGARARPRPRPGGLRCRAPGGRSPIRPARRAVDDGVLAAQPLCALVHRARGRWCRDLPRVPRPRLRARARDRPAGHAVRAVGRPSDGVRGPPHPPTPVRGRRTVEVRRGQPERQGTARRPGRGEAAQRLPDWASSSE